ncbi:MAG: hypothetical protein Q8Q24_01535 [bacterium]|nr:hypothetical protein [bacterium]
MIQKIKKYIKAFNKKLVKIQVALLLTLAYFVLVIPLGFFQKISRKKVSKRGTYWQDIEITNPNIEDFSRQF